MANGWIKVLYVEAEQPPRVAYQRVVDDAVVSYHYEDGSAFTPSGNGSMRAVGYGADAGGRHSAQTDGPNATPPFDTSGFAAADAEARKSLPALSDAPPEPPVIVESKPAAPSVAADA